MTIREKTDSDSAHADAEARPQELDVYPAIEDVLAKHTRGFLSEPTTRENIAQLIDAICETDTRHTQERAAAEAEVAALKSDIEKLRQNADHGWLAFCREHAVKVDDNCPRCQLNESRAEVAALKAQIRELNLTTIAAAIVDELGKWWLQADNPLRSYYETERAKVVVLAVLENRLRELSALTAAEPTK